MQPARRGSLYYKNTSLSFTTPNIKGPYIDKKHLLLVTTPSQGDSFRGYGGSDEDAEDYWHP